MEIWTKFLWKEDVLPNLMQTVLFKFKHSSHPWARAMKHKGNSQGFLSKPAISPKHCYNNSNNQFLIPLNQYDIRDVFPYFAKQSLS